MVNFHDPRGSRGRWWAETDGVAERPTGPVGHPLGAADVAAAAALCVLAACWSWRLGTTFSYDYDEGVYLASAREMLHGAVPFRDVFSSQPPAFLWLLRSALALGGDTVASGRALSVVSAVLACAALAVLARRLAGPWAGPAAVVLCGSSPVFIRMARTCQAEAPALALAIGALALVAGRGRAARTWRQLGAGVLFGLALSTKLLVAPMIAPLVWWAGGWKGTARALGAAMLVALAVAFPHGLPAVFAQAIGFHLGALQLEAAPRAGLLQLVGKGAWLWPLGVAGCVVLRKRPMPLAGLVLWIGAGAAMLMVHRPVFSHHLALLVPPLAAAASAVAAAVLDRAGRIPALALTGLAAALGVGGSAPLRVVEATPAEAAAIDAIVRHSPPGARIVSDHQMLVFRAGRRTPGDLVDTSLVRIEAGSLTLDAVERAAEGAALVVPWTGRLERWQGFAGWLQARCEPLLELPDPKVPGRGVYRVRPSP